MALLSPGQNAFNTTTPANFVSPANITASKQPTLAMPGTQPNFESITGTKSFIGAPQITPNYSQSPTSSANAFQHLANQSQQVFTTTPTGGTSFPIQHVTGVDALPVPTSQNTTPTSQGLGGLLTSSYQTPNGGSITTDSSGNVQNYTPAKGYSIDTSGSIPSSALGNASSMSDVMGQQRNLQDYVNGVAQANGYSPQYLQALQGTYAAQAQGAQLGLNSSALNSNLYTGNNLPGDTMAYAQGATAKAQAQNTLQQSENQIQQLSANQALNTQQLARTGNIAAAQAQLQYSPTAVSEQNAQAQYNTLQSQNEGVNIPAFDPNQNPQTQLQNERMAIATSPAYQSGFQSTYTTPGGGTGIYSKLNVASGALQPDGQGGYQLVSGAAAALGAGNAQIVSTSLQNLSTVNKAIQSSIDTLGTTQIFMQKNGLGDATLPIQQQIINNIKDQTSQHVAITAFNNDLESLRADYAQYLVAAGGGSVAGTGPDSPAVKQAIPSDISLNGIKTVVDQMQTVGTNNATALNNQISQGLSGLNTNSVQSNSGSTAAPGSFASGTGWN